MAGTKKVIFFRRAVFWILMILLLLTAMWIFRLSLLETAGKTALSLAGFEDVSLTISDVSTGQTVIRDLSLGRQIVLRDMISSWIFLPHRQGRLRVLGNWSKRKRRASLPTPGVLSLQSILKRDGRFMTMTGALLRRI